MTPEQIDAWRVVPRLMVLGYGVVLWQVASWFMGLPDPTPSQSAFVSTMTGVGAAVFGLYVNSGNGRKGRD